MKRATLALGGRLLGEGQPCLVVAHVGTAHEGEADVAFNPSGGYHHAHAARAAGFCYINDLVLAAMALALGSLVPPSPLSPAFAGLHSHVGG